MPWFDRLTTGVVDALGRRVLLVEKPRRARHLRPELVEGRPRIPAMVRQAHHGVGARGSSGVGAGRERDPRRRQEKIARAQRFRSGYNAPMLGSPSKVRVRGGKPADATALARIFKDAWLLAYRGIIPHLHLESMVRQRSPEWWRDALKSGDSALVLEVYTGKKTFGTFTLAACQ